MVVALGGVLDSRCGQAESRMVTQEILQQRSHTFAIGIVHFCRGVAGNEEERVIRNQLLRCGTSVAANYRAVRRARSRREFIAKLGIVIEELDESLFWLDLLSAIERGDASARAALHDEANQLLSILVVTRHRTRQRKQS
jgi:four helix bundle protein